MLDRAHAFRLYATLSQAVDRETEKKRREEIQKSRENSTAAGENSTVANSVTGAAQTDKIVIGDADAFAAFAYFDQNLCGHLMERDVEEIVSATALGLTRSQIQKVLKKSSARDKINYRLITDHILDKDTGELKYAPSPLTDAPTLTQLAMGNLGEHSENNSSMMTTTIESDLVLYKGSLFNIAHSLEQSVKLDSERLSAVQRVDALETQLKSVKDAKEVVEKKKRRLEDDLDRYKKRLHDAEKCLKNSQDDTVQIRTAMQECKKMGEKITHLVDKVMPNKEKQQRAKKETSVSAQTKKIEDQSSSTPIVPSTVETGTKENEMDPVKDQQSTETTANGETMVIPEEENKEELDLKLDMAEE